MSAVLLLCSPLLLHTLSLPPLPLAFPSVCAYTSLADWVNTPCALLSPIHRQPLSSKKEQQWYLKDGVTKIQLAETNWCMDAGAKSKAAYGFPSSSSHVGTLSL